jgi:hypothetical protein
MDSRLLYEDTMTNEMRARLKEYWRDLAEIQQHDPSFGCPPVDHWVSELRPPAAHWDSSLPPPDPFYFQAQGQLAPSFRPNLTANPSLVRKVVEHGQSKRRKVFSWVCAAIIVLELVLIFWPGMF